MNLMRPVRTVWGIAFMAIHDPSSAWASTAGRIELGESSHSVSPLAVSPYRPGETWVKSPSAAAIRSTRPSWTGSALHRAASSSVVSGPSFFR